PPEFPFIPFIKLYYTIYHFIFVYLFNFSVNKFIFYPLNHSFGTASKAVGICGSDVHYYKNCKIGDQVVKKPHILGHEVSGLVVKIGKNVKSIKTGTRVAVEPGISCGKCEYCLKDRPNICANVKFLGTPPTNGAFVEYISYPADHLFRLPAGVSFSEGALIETLSVGMYAVELSELKRGDDLAILGCGPIGLVTLKVASRLGASRIFITDVIEERLKFAKKYKNVITINAKDNNPVKIIKQLTRNRGVDLVFEAAGSIETFKQSVEICSIGGKVIWIGIPEEDFVSIDPHMARRKEIIIKLVRRTKHNYQKCIDAITSGNIVVKDMVTHKFKLKDVKKAFKLVENYSDGVMKAMIVGK
ncbi:MAG: alcohol dehydrogenase catalytic domain-containing protein, partial [Candidatus Firestonebacteria bacterium]